MQANPGSFRDPISRVYETAADPARSNNRILRGLDEGALETYERLSQEAFYRNALDKQQIIGTKLLTTPQADVANSILEDGWKGILEHDPIPFVTYPYEWTFSMLKDAALLQLNLIEEAMENGWTLKDATPYNIQWIGPRPTFIDIPSFESRTQGEPWVGYRQFCSMFLTPLLLHSHLGIDHLPLLRSYLEGIPPTEARKFFSGTSRFRRGVMSHIVFPAKVEDSIAKRERNDAPVQRRSAGRQSNAMVIGLVQSLTRLTKKLTPPNEQTDWSHYDKTHSYQDADFEKKKAFVAKHAAAAKRDQIWDIGCNTGTFSRICGEFCNQVIAIDGDHKAVEQLYQEEKKKNNSNILPLVMNISNLSPGQGWAGKERQAFDSRKKPDLVLCLALIHHVRIAANIPNYLFLQWLRSLDADVILEFVGREDEMVVKLLTNKKEQYEDYNLNQFLLEADQLFSIKDREPLKGGNRHIFFLTPR